MFRHALFLCPNAGLETLNDVDEVLCGAVAQALDPLQGGFEEAVGHFIPGKDFQFGSIGCKHNVRCQPLTFNERCLVLFDITYFE